MRASARPSPSSSILPFRLRIQASEESNPNHLSPFASPTTTSHMPVLGPVEAPSRVQLAMLLNVQQPCCFETARIQSCNVLDLIVRHQVGLFLLILYTPRPSQDPNLSKTLSHRPSLRRLRFSNHLLISATFVSYIRFKLHIRYGI